MKVVYLDVLFLENYIIDLLLLMFTGMLNGAFYRKNRMLMAAFTGAAAACGMYFIKIGFAPSLLIELTVCTVMVFLSFGKTYPLNYIKLISTMFLLALFMGGAFMFLGFALQGDAANYAAGGVYFSLSLPLWIAAPAAIIITVPVLSAGGSITSKKKYITIEKNGITLSLYAIADTGCLIRDPATGKKVMIISPEIAEKLLSEGMASEESLIPIPYTTIDSENGYLMAFRADAVKVNCKTEDILIGISPKSIMRSGCAAIIGV